jgi:hypothetical protein
VHLLLVVVVLVVTTHYKVSNEMSIKSKIINAMAAHPKVFAFGIGFAITFAFGGALGIVSPEQAFAGGSCHSCHMQ